MSTNLYRLRQRLHVEMLRKYFSGVPAESLHRSYGYSVSRIKSLALSYSQGKIDIFDPRDKKRIDMAKMSLQEEVRHLRKKVALLEDALKMARIKSESYEIMLDILKDEYGIDLPKKAVAGSFRCCWLRRDRRSAATACSPCCARTACWCADAAPAP